MTKQLSEVAQCAKLIRQDLKARGIKASVRSESYSMGCSVRAAMEDINPIIFNELESAYAKYQYGKFDGMTDMYDITNNRDDIPQTKYLFVENRCSDELKQEIWDFIRPKYSNFKEYPADFTEARNIYDQDLREDVSTIVWRYFKGGYMYEDYWVEQGVMEREAA